MFLERGGICVDHKYAPGGGVVRGDFLGAFLKGSGGMRAEGTQCGGGLAGDRNAGCEQQGQEELLSDGYYGVLFHG
jgi:hypothetical protein